MPGDIAGVVAAVMRHGKLVYQEALGRRDLESGSPMPEDALFRMYSMTRPITSLAAMILWEEGKFQLDEPIKRYLPEFEKQRVFEDSGDPDMAETRERRGEITVEHLVLHTSGLGSRSSDIDEQENVRSRSIPLPQMVANAARVPLFEDPGTRWRYGISTTVLGRLVEIWSGKPLDAFLEERVFEPLGMTDTVFVVDPERAKRLATVYRPSPEGDLRPHAIEDVPFTKRSALLEGGVGLVSTTQDFLRFSQMFLNGARRPSRFAARDGGNDDGQPRARRLDADRFLPSHARNGLESRLLRRDGCEPVRLSRERRRVLVGRLGGNAVLDRSRKEHGHDRQRAGLARARGWVPGSVQNTRLRSHRRRAALVHKYR